MRQNVAATKHSEVNVLAAASPYSLPSSLGESVWVIKEFECEFELFHLKADRLYELCWRLKVGRLSQKSENWTRQQCSGLHSEGSG